MEGSKSICKDLSVKDLGRSRRGAEESAKRAGISLAAHPGRSPMWAFILTMVEV
ncbi:hypothetical protein VMCG_08413 [Cytospora schulzeri]|uniref:Uncharacterized protein n=1 Tax=Cytospora schulzeri TaxID=448051 RepID=A0A423VQY6_9PEZI|nr:hypothetical protein VMCG_08413 [Valsa malicola]